MFIEENLAVFNGEAASAEAISAESFSLLDGLLGQQFYRLSHWKVASEMLNYRRFFTVNELICLNAQHPSVFDQTHGLIRRLVKAGKITGLRIDHIDGLYDPLAYLRRLKHEMCVEGADGETSNVYTTVEKILEVEEKLPNDWPIQGTSGYDFLTYANRLYCQQESQETFSALYESFTGLKDNYEQLFLAKKRLLAESELVGDIDNLAQLLMQVAISMGETASAETFFAGNLRLALKEVMIAFPVYRSYISAMGRSEDDEHYVKAAIETVKSQLFSQGAETVSESGAENASSKRDGILTALSFIERLLLLEDVERLSDEVRSQRLRFIMRMQQFTGPLMAKGIEDTLFYVYNRFTGLNEVGGAPSEFGLSLEAFHSFNQYQQTHWPHNLNASSTHDTKRSEDVRSRLNVLSEMPEVWEQQVMAWRDMNVDNKQVSERPIPTPNDEYFLYQTLVGAYPFDEAELPGFRERIQAYVQKAGREAKENTNWTAINEAYEQGYAEFIEALLADESPFLESLRRFQNSVKRYGIYNALSQLLAKITSPGVPDFYQGSELWDLSLVDPDNRRAVDYELRSQRLQSIKSKWEEDPTTLVKQLMENWEDGSIKLFLAFRGLTARKKFSDVFEKGDYTPLTVTGLHADRVIAFARHLDGQTVIAIAPRFFTGLADLDTLPVGSTIWKDTAIALPKSTQANWKNLLTDTSVKIDNQLLIADACAQLPVALLASENYTFE